MRSACARDALQAATPRSGTVLRQGRFGDRMHFVAATFPERIGRYEVLLPIASGGMGTVYLARSQSIGGFEREVALKVMHPHLKDEPAFAADLVDEAKLAVRIRHPNVVS